MLRRDDRWIWDSWVADDGEFHHLFYLQAPASLGDPGQRHEHASVGVRDQRIGTAVSEDLITWTRISNAPTLEVETRWYKAIPEHPGASETWRDPVVFRDPEGNGWHMFVTARAVGAAPNDDGVLAHATSPDLVSWEVHEPVCAPGAGFGQLEVGQVRVIDGTPVLIFTCHPQEMTGARKARSGYYCTWSVVGESPLGPFDVDTARPFVAEPFLFAAPLVRLRDGRWAFIGFRNTEPAGVLQFHVTDPIPVELRDGALVATGAGTGDCR